MVIGSCWPEDINVLTPFINESKLKFIIAPHELKEEFLSEIERSLQVETTRFSKADANIHQSQVLLIDNIGMLSQLYRYGEFAYVGGAFGKGLHNILEAACYGVPIFFGNTNYDKFKEATDLILRGGAFEISSYTDLKAKYELLNSKPESFLMACEVTRQYVKENLGATQKIVDFCKKYLTT
jgi:3-deoxy-D-manno-octulosonic-acid transferase